MTDEPKGLTEKWIDDKGAQYAYAYDKGGKLSRYFGVQGIPHAVLIDPTGTVVWKDHPGGLDESTIEKALEGAIKKPLYDWPASAAAAKGALSKQQYAKALGAAEKLGDQELVDTIKSLIGRKVQVMKEAHEAGNFLTASDLSEQLAAGLAGLPEGEEASKISASIKADKDAPAVIKAQKRIRELAMAMGDLGSKKSADKMLAELQKISEQSAGTYASKEAAKVMEAVRKVKSSFD